MLWRPGVCTRACWRLYHRRETPKSWISKLVQELEHQPLLPSREREIIFYTEWEHILSWRKRWSLPWKYTFGGDKKGFINLWEQEASSSHRIPLKCESKWFWGGGEDISSHSSMLISVLRRSTSLTCIHFINPGKPQRHCWFGFRPPQQTNITMESCNLFAGGNACFQFVKNVTSMKHNKTKCNKMRYVWPKSQNFYISKIML